MQMVRVLSVLLLLGAQAAGGSVFGMLRVCRMQAALATRSHCHCPHQLKKGHRDAGPGLVADCCGTPAKKSLPPAVVSPPRTTPMPALAVAAPQWTSAPADAGALSDLYQSDVHPSQGPPLFLRIQTLLS
jgi:hypothetical protein